MAERKSGERLLKLCFFFKVFFYQSWVRKYNKRTADCSTAPATRCTEVFVIDTKKAYLPYRFSASPCHFRPLTHKFLNMVTCQKRGLVWYEILEVWPVSLCEALRACEGGEMLHSELIVGSIV